METLRGKSMVTIAQAMLFWLLLTFSVCWIYTLLDIAYEAICTFKGILSMNESFPKSYQE